MNSVLNNLVNGNLTDAKEGAKKYDLTHLASYFRRNGGMSFAKAAKAARYLKFPSEETFQSYCDAK